MNFRQGNESATEIQEFPYFRWNPENMNFRQGNESTTEIHEFPYFRWKPENMNFRQGNESITEIHEFPYFRRDGETWISVKEMKALQKFMNFRISVEMPENMNFR